MASVLSFFQETYTELKKVVWPTRSEVIRLTGVVVLVSVMVGLYIGGLDLIFTSIISRFVK